jgi:hypothetical protein
MPELRKIKAKDKFYLRIPEGLAGEMPDVMEIFKLKDGYFIITPALGAPKEELAEREKPAEKKDGKNGNEEFALLYGISLIPFSKRDIESVLIKLKESERKMLHQMVDSRIVSLVEKDGKKYIQFSSELYSRLKSYSSEGKINAQQKADAKISDYAVFSKDDFNVFYRATSQNELRSLAIVPWFDGKVYVASRNWIMGQGQKAVELFRKKGELTDEEMAKELGIGADGARTVAISLCNEGIMVESKKGHYALAE